MLERLIYDALSKQDPNAPHTWLTRIVVSLIILGANIVLYGFYGFIGSIIFYLLGVELAGLGIEWMFLPFLLGILLGIWKTLSMLVDYWRNWGHG